jgi:hypothetical protein
MHSSCDELVKQIKKQICDGAFFNLFIHEELNPSNILFPLRLYSPIQALAASTKLSVSLQLRDLGQSVGLLGQAISSVQGLYLYTGKVKSLCLSN